MLLRRRTRKIGTGALAAGLAGIGAALTLPVREKRATSNATRLDEAMPVWEFDERHEIEIAAAPEAIFDAIRAIRADDIFLFRTFVNIRTAGCQTEENILNPSRDKPILDVALQTGFFVMADDTPREMVIGMVVMQPNRAIAAMNFRIDGNRLTTETRVHTTDAGARRRFAVYWRLIHPGSDIIRRMWLQAIRRRAEEGASGG